MKGGVAMLLSAFLRAKVEEARPAGGRHLSALSDEEESGTYGARFLTEEHRELFDGVRYALGEFGGFSLRFGASASTRSWWRRSRAATCARRCAAPAGMARCRCAAGRWRGWRSCSDTRPRPAAGPHHAGPRAMIAAVAKTLPTPNGPLLRQLLNPRLTDRMLDALGERGELFDPLLHNTVDATIMRGGEKGNVIPSETTVDMDGRILPGYTQDELLRELRALVGSDVELEAVEFDSARPPRRIWGCSRRWAASCARLTPRASRFPI